ncbi:hypothetical protein QKT49_gp031 [Acanthamoeba castellanii medusavirus]|uniref:Uncharacterized protein n=1 Tax=Acanthamoeba castellanii medusavirus J1 TaxID=3114988 RepID=A0A3T1CWG7_9VIRU|nr:hypothetical protein QKT49_gp031 [Acanthamoeba castellanii medusavirus]BBI30171.1 hypothetical protein [Acanthamoeba castellanii medusavirus J1]
MSARNNFYIITTKPTGMKSGKYNTCTTLDLPSGRTIRVEYNHYFETLPGDRIVRTSALFDTEEQALDCVKRLYDKQEWMGDVEILGMRREILACGCRDGWCDCNI